MSEAGGEETGDELRCRWMPICANSVSMETESVRCGSTWFGW